MATRSSRGQTVPVAFIIDGSDPTVAGGALSAATLLGQTQSVKLQVQQLSRQTLGGMPTTAVDVRSQVWYNPDMVSAYFMIPGMIGMILQMMTTLLTAVAIVRERERGTIEQLIVTPIRSWELIVGKLVPYVVIAFGDAARSSGARNVVVPRAGAREHWAVIGIGGLVRDDDAQHRPVHFDDCPYAARSHADDLYDDLADHFPFGLFLSRRRDAAGVAVDQRHHPAQIFSDHRPQHRAQRRWAQLLLIRDGDLGSHGDCDDGCGVVAFPQAIGLG